MPVRPIEERDWFLPSEAARLLGVDQRTLSRWAASNKVPCIRTLGGHRRYLKAPLQELARFDRESNKPESKSERVIDE